MNAITSVVKRHPIAAFFVLAYTFSWLPWVLGTLAPASRPFVLYPFLGGGPLTAVHEALLTAPALETQFDDAELVWAALHRLPEHERVPLLLQSWAGYSLNDIAAVLGCNVNTIKTRVWRTRLRFRRLYVA